MQQLSNAAESAQALSASSGATSRQPPAPAAWAAVRDVIYRLYCEEELPLHQVKDYLERNHGFRASERMYKDRLKKWGFSKNLTKDDWVAVAVLNIRRKTSGKRSSHFFVKGRRKTLRDLQKYSRSQGVNEDRLAETASANIEIPEYLRACTPEDDAGLVKDSPSDDSPRSSSSPKQEPARLKPGTATNACVTSPVDWQHLRTSSIDGASKWSPGDFAFAAVDSHEPSTQFGRRVPFHVSPISQSSASLMTTASTMATSVTSADIEAGPTIESSLPWPNTSDVLPPHAEDALASSWTSGSPSIPSSCDNLSQEVEFMSHQLTDPVPLRSRRRSEDIQSWMLLDPPTDDGNPDDFVCSCAVCHQPSASHFVSIHNTVPQEVSRNILDDSTDAAFGIPATTKDEGAWKWIALCFASCLNLTKRNYDLADKSLYDASAHFEKLLLRRDRLLLTAANQMITILHMHNQGAIATKVIKSAKSATDRTLLPTDPVRITIDYLAATTDSSSSSALTESGITSDTLRAVYEMFNEHVDYGSEHPYTIAAAYNHAWLLRYEGRFAEAEQNLPSIYEKSCSIFGKHHMQSITALATLAGAQFGQKKNAEAVENFKTVIRDCKPTLGKSHPYRLEAKRRLALQYEDLGQTKMMIPLYWDVLVGRVYMLGRHHPYTLGQKQAYEELMKKMGKWDLSTQEKVEELFASKRRAEEEATRRRRSGSGSSNEDAYRAY